MSFFGIVYFCSLYLSSLLGAVNIKNAPYKFLYCGGFDGQSTYRKVYLILWFKCILKTNLLKWFSSEHTLVCMNKSAIQTRNSTLSRTDFHLSLIFCEIIFPNEISCLVLKSRPQQRSFYFVLFWFKECGRFHVQYFRKTWSSISSP